ncbi:MAG: site-specific DNA-methyltransferase [Acidothermales bacterium]|nr:site-specific DNA-methyltransferase [Acidothermales bacterium]
MSGGLRNDVLVGDARESLSRLPDASIDMVLTSPPYFRLRNYDIEGQLGLEASVPDWVGGLHLVLSEVQRVLVPTGSLWLNLGDSYSTHLRQGAAKKSLLLGPERLALRLVADGWMLRNKLVWAKANPMPSSVRDRLTATHEYIYVLTRQPRSFFDLDAIRQPHVSRPTRVRSSAARAQSREPWRGPNGDDGSGLTFLKARGLVGHPLGKNPGDVWRLASSNYRGGHHATFPLALADRAIRAGCPEARCTACRLPWRRATIRALGGTAIRGTLRPTCNCAAPSEPGVVLDPFFGAGTTGVAAEALGRNWLGVELNPDFADLAERRIAEARASAKAAA